MNDAKVCVCVEDGTDVVLDAQVRDALNPEVVTEPTVCVCVVAVLVPPYVLFPLGNLLSSAENLVNPEGTVVSKTVTIFCSTTNSVFEQKIMSKYGGSDVEDCVTKVTLL